MLTDRPLSWDKALSPLPWDLPAIEDDLADRPSSSQPSTEDLSKLSVETLAAMVAAKFTADSDCVMVGVSPAPQAVTTIDLVNGQDDDEFIQESIPWDQRGYPALFIDKSHASEHI